ncbi:hypothetical protein JCM8202_003937 [Rhodotorula sphaerocarpa]
MNTLAAFSSPFVSLHLAHPAATSSLLEQASTSCGGSFFKAGSTSRSALEKIAVAEASSSRSRFAIGRITSSSSSKKERHATAVAAAVRPRRLEISSPVLVSSSNPIAYELHAASYLPLPPREGTDVPCSLTLASLDSRRYSILPPPPYTPIAAKERTLVDAEEVDRRLSEYDEEYQLGVRDELALKDERMAGELRRMSF